MTGLANNVEGEKMTAPFFDRLTKYFEQVSAVLRGEAGVASIFPNTTDIGMSRERVYAKFLEQHVPSKCNVFLGGFLFGEDGTESKQLDVIVTTDTCPRYDFHNAAGAGKSFAPVEGTLAVASIKSTLNEAAIKDALLGIASIPATQPLAGRGSPMLTIDAYDHWPFKIVYASDGVAGSTALAHVNQFYVDHPDILDSRRPDLIHVVGKYVISKSRVGTDALVNPSTGARTLIPHGQFFLSEVKPDVQALVTVVNEIQTKALVSTHILFSYQSLFAGVMLR